MSAPTTLTRDIATMDTLGANAWTQLQTVIGIPGTGTDTRTWQVGVRRGAGSEVTVVVNSTNVGTFTITDVGPASLVIGTP